MNRAVYVFPGQGSQFAGMGRDLYAASPAARAVFDEADETLGFALSRLCFEGPDDELTKTVNAQPALLTMSCACLAAMREACGDALPRMFCTAGHSLGEYSALVAAGAMDFPTAVRLARERGRLMYEAGLEVPGAMAAVIAMDEDALAKVCSESGVWMANLNCPGQIVISGEAGKVDAASSLARERGAKYVFPLQVSGAFHTPLMQPAADRLAPLIDEAEVHDPAVPVTGNTRTRAITTAQGVKDELVAQVCSPVQWQRSMQGLIDAGADTFIEVGPGSTLCGFMARICPTATAIHVGDAAAIENLRDGGAEGAT